MTPIWPVGVLWHLVECVLIQPLDFCSEAMLEGWKQDEENFQSADEQFAAYIKFYNACFKVRTFIFPLLHLLTLGL